MDIDFNKATFKDFENIPELNMSQCAEVLGHFVALGI